MLISSPSSILNIGGGGGGGGGGGETLLFIIHAFCSSGIPLKFSHDDNCDDNCDDKI